MSSDERRRRQLKIWLEPLIGRWPVEAYDDYNEIFMIAILCDWEKCLSNYFSSIHSDSDWERFVELIELCENMNSNLSDNENLKSFKEIYVNKYSIVHKKILFYEKRLKSLGLMMASTFSRIATNNLIRKAHITILSAKNTISIFSGYLNRAKFIINSPFVKKLKIN